MVETATTSFGDCVARFRDSPETIERGTEGVLSLLEQSEGMATVWDKLMAHPRVNPATVLALIVENRALVSLNRDLPSTVAHEDGRAMDLRKAADLLTKHYKERPLIGTPKTNRVAQMLNDGVLQARAALDWIDADLTRSKHALDKAYEATFPKSQKRGDERFSFAMMMVASMDFYFGQPFYDFVGHVSNALYQKNDTIDLETVRKARAREKRG